MKRKTKLQFDIDSYYLAAIFIIITLTFVMTLKQMGEMYSDISVHARWAGAGRVDPTYAKFSSYPVWHLGVQLWANKLHLPLKYAAAVVTSGFSFLTTTVIYKVFKMHLVHKHPRYIFLLTLGVSLVTTLYIPFADENIFINYCGPNVWHNPTNMAVKSFAVFSFFMFYKIYDSYKNGCSEKKTSYFVILSAVLLASCMVKPSFMQGFLPAVVLFLFVELIVSKGKIFRFCLQAACVFLPSALFMLYQLLSVFTPDQERSMQISFMEVIGGWSPHPWISIILCVAFPLYVMLIFYKTLFKDKMLWLTFVYGLVSLAEAVMLVEMNEPYSGNFCWAWQLAMGIMFISAAIRFYQTYSWKMERIRGRVIWSIGTGLLFWHVCSGIYYYGRLLLTAAWYR